MFHLGVIAWLDNDDDDDNEDDDDDDDDEDEDLNIPCTKVLLCLSNQWISLS